MRRPVVPAGPTGRGTSEVRVPGSKSIANRALVCAFLASGNSRVVGVPNGDDCARMLDAMKAADSVTAAGNGDWIVAGGGADRLPDVMSCGLAGTTSRFLTAVAATSARTHVLDGEAPLRRRPMADLHDALRALGAEVVALDGVGRLPVRVGGGRLSGGHVSVGGEGSSQFASALLLIGPVLPEGLDLRIDGGLVSASYLAMTQRVMESFGAVVTADSARGLWRVEPTGYRAAEYVVEADHSSAAFPIAAVLLRGGTVRIPGLRRGGGQGDERMLDIVAAMGAEVRVDPDGIEVSHDGSPPRAVDVDMRDCSDLVPAVAVVCLAARGTSHLRGIGFIRTKESNRIEGLAGQLARCGADVRAEADGLEIVGGSALRPTMLSTLDDHRLGMAFAVLSLLCPGTGIDDAGVVAKSWPSFFSDMETLLGPCRNPE